MGDDPDVCPYYICSFCPNDLFVNTKSDLGQCEWFHQDDLKREYDKQPRSVKRRVEKKLLQYLYELVSDVDRRIRRGKERIALNAPSTQPNPIIEQQIEQKKKSIELRCNQLDAEINKLKEHIEVLCNEGKIDDAEAMLKQVETLEADKDNLQNMDVSHVGMKDPRSDKNRFQICEICGVFQAVDDAEDRIARHFEGKQHKGFDIIRQEIKTLEALHSKELNELNEQQRKERRGRDEHRMRRRDRDRSRDRDRGRRRRSRSRSRDRSRRKHRSRRSDSSRRRDRERDSRRKDKRRDRRRRDRSRSESESKHRRKKSRSGSESRAHGDGKDKDGDVSMKKDVECKDENGESGK